MRGPIKVQSLLAHMRCRARLKDSFVLLTLLSLVAGCSDSSGKFGLERKPPLVLGFSQLVSQANWNRANAESIRQAALDAGIELRLDDAKRSQEKQVAALRSFVKQNVDVIAFSPAVETGWEFVLREIRSAGIPVILVDRSIAISDDSLYVSVVGSDFFEEGRRAARWLLENTRDMHGQINIVELQGTVDSSPAIGRSRGFTEVIATDPRYRVIRSLSGDFYRDRAREILAGFLKGERRPIHVLFAHSDSMALGAVEAIEAAGLKPGSDIMVISIEGSRIALEAIIAGRMNMTVECNPLIGPQLMAVVKDAAAGKEVPRRVVTQETLFTRENAAAELPNRLY